MINVLINLNYLEFNNFLTPKIIPRPNKAKMPPSMGSPGGGGGEGGGGPTPWATDTKLINTNKIEANIFLFCTTIIFVKV